MCDVWRRRPSSQQDDDITGYLLWENGENLENTEINTPLWKRKQQHRWEEAPSEYSVPCLDS